ncbi:MAG: hypothetical protein COV41_03120 [Candidatus Brennerbacteria bacterium CG11_big_fil_rev_8_21_14_0_20_43_10]|uniref:Uncharacterized protein n=3 Tax=Candidatus Brenneribacteriota TaxID=1817902 RepID=A0A2H0PTD2_9BACT|nr:MAG: hypothetical protein AUJ43_00065 [Parcubacteria group bacterium CG1_02_44_31]PIR25319.1 MAG: hypothetical protein COV41_03120 [Candidatus Brennerbacteria bacterium CG11_big_fil_rev_8_21_14_0_20_43_10]
MKMQKIIVVSILILLSWHTCQGITVQQGLEQPVPSPSTFAPQALAWLEQFWSKITYYANIVLSTPLDSPIFITIIKAGKWFWGFSIMTIKEGFNAAIALGKLLLNSSGIDWSKIQMPWN